jgi:lycopene cyclase-like protein
MHVVILGCGPAGCLFAEALSSAADVTVVGPAQPWSATYGVWTDELPGSVDYEATWSTANVRLSKDSTFEIDRAYGRLNNAATRAALLNAARANGARVYEERAEIVSAERGRVQLVETDDTLDADVVIDARGAAEQKASIWQQAFGVEIEAPAGMPEALTFMDFASTTDAPRFLYSMCDGGRVFVEETVLAGRQLLPWDELEGALRARLERMGVPWSDPVRTERCVIPMDLPLQMPRGRVVPVGAGAGWVHPAAGYSLGFTARKAQQMRQQLASSAGSELWDPQQRACDNLYRFGGQMLADFDLDDLRSFFTAFFEQDAPAVNGFLSRTLGLNELRRLMWSTYLTGDRVARGGVRSALLRHPGLFIRGFPGVARRVGRRTS